MKLTPKQKAFADYYIQTSNATEAAIKAGYSKKTARVIGQENLTKLAIKNYIDERMAIIEDARIAKVDEVLQYLTRVIRDEENEDVIVVENVGDYTSEARVIKKRLSAKDRIKAAEHLGKVYGVFVEKQQVDHKVKVEENWFLEE